MTDPATILLPASKTGRAVPITAVAAAQWPEVEKALAPQDRDWLKATGFEA